MSKLDDILEQVWQNGNKPVRQGESYLYNTEAKQQIKELFLDLIDGCVDDDFAVDFLREQIRKL
jgi:glycerol-3-phosphate responsive antiterminator